MTGTVPVNKDLLAGTVPVNKELLTGTVPVNKELLTGRVPVNNLFPLPKLTRHWTYSALWYLFYGFQTQKKHNYQLFGNFFLKKGRGY